MTPEPCLKGRCRSPVACEGWGYCRERNLEDDSEPTMEKMAERREIAKGRNNGNE